MRWFGIIFICFTFIIVSNGYAATIGDPIEPIGKGVIAMAAEQNLIFSREVEYGQFRQIDIKDAYQWYAKGIYGLGEYFNIYAKLGISDLEHKIKEGGNDFDIEYDLGPLWGVGILAATPRWHGLNVGLDSQYAGWYVEVESLKYNQERSADEIGSVLVTEIQETLFVSYSVEAGKNSKLIPYLGISYLYLNNETKDTIEYDTPQKNGTIDFDIDNTQDFHFILGADFVCGENVSLTLEGTVIYDNRGVMMGYSYKF
ncbi:MAG: hypothetical protein ABH843_02305 [Candidatus Omnitrophota bacterium]